MKKILVILGTRPEAIKLAPLILELRKHPDLWDVMVCATGQHKEIVAQVLGLFRVFININIDNTKPAQSLANLNANILSISDFILQRERPDLVIVQGDTASAFAGALAAFYNGIPVAHVEAGLRSGSMQSPFPEELNRVLISRMATWHFAPTSAARDHLLKEGIASKHILLSGNTGIDALHIGLESVRSSITPQMDALRAKIARSGQKLLIVTLHRRENLPLLDKICRALLRLMKEEQFSMIFAMHPNPDVQKPVQRILGNHNRIQLTEPLAYHEFLFALDQCSLIITDSGGIQEEAPTLGKPVVVLRSHTERQELINVSGGVLCDPHKDNLKEAVHKALAIKIIPGTKNPFGDGQASRRIADFLRGKI